jgi:hypothetical protein
MGRLDLVNDDTADVDEHGPHNFRWEDDDDDLAAQRMREACAPEPEEAATPQAGEDLGGEAGMDQRRERGGAQ